MSMDIENTASQHTQYAERHGRGLRASKEGDGQATRTGEYAWHGKRDTVEISDDGRRAAMQIREMEVESRFSEEIARFYRETREEEWQFIMAKMEEDGDDFLEKMVNGDYGLRSRFFGECINEILSEEQHAKLDQLYAKQDQLRIMKGDYVGVGDEELRQLLNESKNIAGNRIFGMLIGKVGDSWKDAWELSQQLGILNESNNIAGYSIFEMLIEKAGDSWKDAWELSQQLGSMVIHPYGKEMTCQYGLTYSNAEWNDMYGSMASHAADRESGRDLAEYIAKTYFDDPKEAQAFMDKINNYIRNDELKDMGCGSWSFNPDEKYQISIETILVREERSFLELSKRAFNEKEREAIAYHYNHVKTVYDIIKNARSEKTALASLASAGGDMDVHLKKWYKEVFIESYKNGTSFKVAMEEHGMKIANFVVAEQMKILNKAFPGGDIPQGFLDELEDFLDGIAKHINGAELKDSFEGCNIEDLKYIRPVRRMLDPDTNIMAVGYYSDRYEEWIYPPKQSKETDKYVPQKVEEDFSKIQQAKKAIVESLSEQVLKQLNVRNVKPNSNHSAKHEREPVEIKKEISELPESLAEDPAEIAIFKALDGKVENAKEVAKELRDMIFSLDCDSEMRAEERVQMRAEDREAARNIAEYIAENYLNPEEAQAFMDKINEYIKSSEERDLGGNKALFIEFDMNAEESFAQKTINNAKLITDFTGNKRWNAVMDLLNGGVKGEG